MKEYVTIRGVKMTEPFKLEKESYLSIIPWENENSTLTVGFSTKNGGFSQGYFSSLNLGLHVNDSDEDVKKNKKTLSNQLQWETKEWVACEQIHSNNIVKVHAQHKGSGLFNYSSSIKGTDGIYTKEKNILLTLCYADCVPIYFWSEPDEMIGVAHAGWKGTVNEIGKKMIEAWLEEGIKVENIKVAIGPAISSCCYVVNDYVMDKVKQLIGDKPVDSIWSEIETGQYKLHLQRLNEALLLQVGIKQENIIVSSYCTSCEDDLFFSHRRDEGKTGRMLSFIGLKEEQ